MNHRIGSTVRANYYHWVSKGDYQYIDENGEWADVDSGAVATEFYNANPDEHIVFGDPVVGPYGDSGVKSWNLLAQIYCFSPELTADTDRFIRALEKAAGGTGRTRKPAAGAPRRPTLRSSRISKPSTVTAVPNMVLPLRVRAPMKAAHLQEAWATKSTASTPCSSSHCP